MIRIIGVAFVLAIASSSAQAMPLAPIQQPDSMITQVVAGCGVGRTRVNGVCVARTTNAMPAGARNGMEAIAHTITERKSNNGPRSRRTEAGRFD